ncbi:hypothetical protein TNCV_1886071 [Trichonephila clavipes]|nr:hypothetical protein TNCV_1886071 [Trichonephila clavipes]
MYEDNNIDFHDKLSYLSQATESSNPAGELIESFPEGGNSSEQFRSDASLEAVDRRAPNNSKNWQWTMEGDVSARRLTPAPHGGE